MRLPIRPLVASLLLAGSTAVLPADWQVVETMTIYEPSAQDSGRLVRRALAHLVGDGVPQDDGEAVRLYEQAADLGSSYAMMSLGWAARNGRGRDRNDADALAWFKRAADAGDLYSMMMVGSSYREGRGTMRDPREGFRWVADAARRGYARAYVQMADAFARGYGVERDPEVAEYWMQQAAHSDDIVARTSVANRRAIGDLHPRDIDQANSLYSSIDDVSWAIAQRARYILSGVHVEGEPLAASDPREALRQYLSQRSGINRVAGQFSNISEAAALLYAGMLAEGIGGPRDAEASRMILLREAERGNRTALAELALRSLQGCESSIATPLARDLLVSAANQHDLLAMSALGAELISGTHFTEDPQTGIDWLRRASSFGDDNARVLLYLLAFTGQGGDLTLDEGIDHLMDAALDGVHTLAFLLAAEAIDQGIADPPPGSDHDLWAHRGLVRLARSNVGSLDNTYPCLDPSGSLRSMILELLAEVSPATALAWQARSFAIGYPDDTARRDADRLLRRAEAAGFTGADFLRVEWKLDQ
jgi:uncharacterized protein